MENKVTLTVFGKKFTTIAGSVANSFQSYLVEALGIPNKEAYAITCLGFGYRYSVGSSFPKDLTYQKIYLIIMALPDEFEY